MLTELVAARLLAVTVASGAAASSDDVYPNKVCNHGAATLFIEEITPSILYYMAFVEQTGAVDKVENVLYSARDSVKFQIVAAHQALKVIEKWGVGMLEIEIHKGGGNSYLRLCCRNCGKATEQLFENEEFSKIFDDVFGIDRHAATF